MSTYIRQGQPLEFDNAPDWLVAYMQYRLTVLGNTDKSTMTFFVDLRGFFQWVKCYTYTGKQPRTAEELQCIDILDLPVSAVLNVTRTDIETYLFFLANTLGNGAKTRNKKLCGVRGFYDYILDHKAEMGIELSANPTDRIQRPKQPKTQPVFLPCEDQTALLEGITGENACRDYAIILLLLVAGLRNSELCNLDVQDVNLKAMTVRVRRGKGRKERTAYLTLPCCEAIRKYMEEYRAGICGLDTNALFVSRLKTRLTPRSIENILYKHTLNANLAGKGYTPHKLRHTTATMMAKDGEDLLKIQMVMGHESPVTTEIYTHLDSTDISKAVNRSSLAELGKAPVYSGEE